MNRISARTLTFFDTIVIDKIIEKYGFEEHEAIDAFLQSKTYKMLIDKELEIYAMSPLIVFDMWEAERVCGDPRDSQYIR